MKLLLDMNLSPSWCEALSMQGHDVVHWSTVGAGAAADDEVMSHARREGRVVVTNDLDFGALLASTHAEGPSVVLLRVQDLLPDALGPRLALLLERLAVELARGAIVVLGEQETRVRVLPLLT